MRVFGADVVALAWLVIALAMAPARAESAGSGASAREISDGNRPKSRVDALAPERAPWEVRLADARSRAEQIPSSQLLRALDTSDEARVFAALEQAYLRKVTLPEAALRVTLQRSQGPEAAYAAAYQLAQHGTASARKALARYVVEQGQGYRRIAELLGDEAGAALAEAREALARRERWMQAAALERAGSAVQLEAIRGLATEPGEEVEALLEQLRADPHEEVARTAAAALALRRDRGP